MAKKSLCSIPGCGKVGKLRRGWCGTHYARWQSHGDPLAPTVRGYRVAHKFLVEAVLPFNGDDCLLWPFRRDPNGYARIDVNGRNRIATQYICQLVNGSAPSLGMEAAHSCGNGHLGCVNPKHLEWKSRKENMADMVSHGRATWGERNARAKLTEEQVLFILSKRGRVTQKKLAEMFGLHQSHVSDILSGKRWAHLQAP